MRGEGEKEKEREGGKQMGARGGERQRNTESQYPVSPWGATSPAAPSPTHREEERTGLPLGRREACVSCLLQQAGG
jgi:hypothetical protein